MISNPLSVIGGDMRKCRKNIISIADFIKRNCFVCISPSLYSTLLYNISSWSATTYFGLNMMSINPLLFTSSLQQNELMIINRFPDICGNIQCDGWCSITLFFYGIHWGPIVTRIARTTSLGRHLPHMFNLYFLSHRHTRTYVNSCLNNTSNALCNHLK